VPLPLPLPDLKAPARACDDTAVPILMHQCTDRPAGPAEEWMRSCITPGSEDFRFLIYRVAWRGGLYNISLLTAVHRKDFRSAGTSYSPYSQLNPTVRVFHSQVLRTHPQCHPASTSPSRQPPWPALHSWPPHKPMSPPVPVSRNPSTQTVTTTLRIHGAPALTIATAMGTVL
jgi:hypothetical protein